MLECSQWVGANITDHSVQTVGKCTGRIQTLLYQYDQVSSVHKVSGSHSKQSTKVDLDKLLTQLQDSEGFDVN